MPEHPPVIIILVGEGEADSDVVMVHIEPRWINPRADGTLEVGLSLNNPVLREAMKLEGVF